MIRFYAPDIEATGLLPEAESHHALSVLRMAPGQELHAVDGRGHAYVCRLAGKAGRQAAVDVVERRDEPTLWTPQRITVAVAPTKSADRMEWMLEKLVEMGIDRFVPVVCDRSERRKVNRERLERVAVAAMKQSLKAVLPEVSDAMPLGTFLREADPGQQCFMAHCDEALAPRRAFAKAYVPAVGVRVLVGPEGDFSPAEVEAAARAGYIAVTFGDNRLRTETAALFAVAAMHTLNSLN